MSDAEHPHHAERCTTRPVHLDLSAENHLLLRVADIDQSSAAAGSSPGYTRRLVTWLGSDEPIAAGHRRIMWPQASGDGERLERRTARAGQAFDPDRAGDVKSRQQREVSNAGRWMNCQRTPLVVVGDGQAWMAVPATAVTGAELAADT